MLSVKVTLKDVQGRVDTNPEVKVNPSQYIPLPKKYLSLLILCFSSVEIS